MPNTLDAQIALAAAYLADGQKDARGRDRPRDLDRRIPRQARPKTQVLEQLRRPARPPTTTGRAPCT